MREIPVDQQPRIANYLKELRHSPDPAALLRQWFPEGPRFLDQDINPENPRFAANHGHLLVAYAFQGADDKVVERLSRRYIEYLRKPQDLAAVVRSERLIQGLTPEELARQAGAPLRDVRSVEDEHTLTNPVYVRRILRALGIEASALPPMPLPRD